MSKMLAVRIPDTLHTYLSHRALIANKSKQQLVTEIIMQYQMSDADYMTALDDMATEALKNLSGGGAN
ncbi:MAG: hypothetical protein Q4B88_06385 [Moraxella sp.]|nr:hypothetical protein [Moraxella sp.]